MPDKTLLALMDDVEVWADGMILKMENIRQNIQKQRREVLGL